MKAGRLFIPTEMRADILTKIHGAHQGITQCKLRARESVWWLAINSDIENEVKACDVCAKLQNDHAEPMISTKFELTLERFRVRPFLLERSHVPTGCVLPFKI